MKSVIKISVFILLFLLASYAVPANAATTYYFGGAKKTLSAATVTIEAGYYDTTDLTAVATQLAADNIKSGTTIFGITGTLAGGGTYGLPKTGQQPGYGAPFYAGDDCSYASPETHDVGYPRGTGSWANYNAARFTMTTITGDVVVTDNATGLMWVADGNSAGCFSGGTKTWTQAIASAEGLTFAGYSDWRLPNVKELLSIVDYWRSNPAIDPTYFPHTQPLIYWSSTTYISGGNAWGVYFLSGGLSTLDKAVNNEYVRPVRGGQ
jgi:hypothetical protein